MKTKDILKIKHSIREAIDFIATNSDGDKTTVSSETIILLRDSLKLLQIENEDKNTVFNLPLIASAICDAIDDNQEQKVDRNMEMFLTIEKVLRLHLLVTIHNKTFKR